MDLITKKKATKTKTAKVKMDQHGYYGNNPIARALELADMALVPPPEPINLHYLREGVMVKPANNISLHLQEVFSDEHVHVFLRITIDEGELELENVCLHRDRPTVIMRHTETYVPGLILVLRTCQDGLFGIQVTADQTLIAEHTKEQREGYVV